MAVMVQLMRRLVYAISVMTLVSLAACGDSSTQQPTAAAPQESVAPATAGPTTSVVPAALAFTATQVGGGTINMGKYAGTPVLLWFWAPT